MKLLRLFRKLVYAQVLVGTVAYGVAASEIPLAIIAAALALLSWVVVEGPQGRPLPRWFINLGLLAVMVYLIHVHVTLNRPELVSLGQFVLLIQVFKLYERKANRDWGQLIVLSLMLMVCASILSADVIFGVLLVVYLATALLAILVFQIKLGHDQVNEANRRQAPPDRQPAPAGLPATARYQRQFNQLAAGTGIAAILLSTIFFLLIPRGQGSGVLGDWNGDTSRKVSGYNDEINLSGGGRMSTSDVPVMNVAFSQNGNPVGSGGQFFLLRGTALDRYDAETQRWTRGDRVTRTDRAVDIPRGEDFTQLHEGHEPDPRFVLTQAITLRAQPRNALFAAFSPLSVKIDRDVRFSPDDQSLGTRDSVKSSIQYVVESSQEANPELIDAYRRRWQRVEPLDTRSGGPPTLRWESYARRPLPVSDRVVEFTQQLLADRDITRDPQATSSPDDRYIADIIARYLQTRLNYSLDIPPVDRHRDPIDAFLFEYQRGHCEFFASAMCAMLRSVGVRSRVVTGFRATEYNAMGGYYVVRARNAHAWVEVWLEDEGWATYDPSPPVELDNLHQPEGGIFATLRDLYEYIEFQWIRNIVTYDSTQQQTVMTRLNDRVSALTESVTVFIDSIQQRVQAFYRNWLVGVTGYLMLVGLLLTVGAGGYMLLGNLSRQRRFMRRLKLDSVGRREKRRLARELDFYFKALQLIETSGRFRPAQKPPGQFAAELADDDPERYQPLVPLTDLFYEIRFGGRELDTARRETAEQHLNSLRERLLPVAA